MKDRECLGQKMNGERMSLLLKNISWINFHEQSCLQEACQYWGIVRIGMIDKFSCALADHFLNDSLYLNWWLSHQYLSIDHICSLLCTCISYCLSLSGERMRNMLSKILIVFIERIEKITCMNQRQNWLPPIFLRILDSGCNIFSLFTNEEHKN